MNSPSDRGQAAGHRELSNLAILEDSRGAGTRRASDGQELQEYRDGDRSQTGNVATRAGQGAGVVVIAASALEAHAAWLAAGEAGAGTDDAGRLVVRGEDAHGQDLRSAQLSRAVIEGCKLDGAQLAGTRWAGATATATSFRDAVFADAELDGARFVDCDLRDADFSALAATGAGAAGTTKGCRFERCDLRGSVWLDRDLSGAEFVDCRFDLVAGAVRAADGVAIEGARLLGPAREAGGEPAERTAEPAEILALWGVGQARPRLDDDDKAFIHRGLLGRWRKREAQLARGPRPAMATGPGSLADKWSEPFLPTVGAAPAASAASDAGEPIALPAGTAAGVTARRSPSGTAIYRDPRSGFTIGLPSPVFLAPSSDMDATVGVGGAVLHICHLPRTADVEALEEVASLVHEVTGAEAEPLDLVGDGVAAAAIATARQGDLVREVAAITGGHGSVAGTALLMLNYRTGDVDAVAALTVWSAVLSSAAFGPTRERFPLLVPASAWWQPGMPLRPADAPPAQLRGVAGAREIAVGLLAITELLPPSQTINDVVRGEVARRLTGAGVTDAARIAATLTTIHDLRGLAVALAPR
jgi:hypothetical protein